jgi:hypothetical protein
MFACAVQCVFGQLGRKKREREWRRNKKMNIVSPTDEGEQVEKNRKGERKKGKE